MLNDSLGLFYCFPELHYIYMIYVAVVGNTSALVGNFISCSALKEAPQLKGEVQRPKVNEQVL